MNRLIRGLASGVLVIALAGCAGAPSSSRSEVVTLPGTGDSQDVLRALARSYLAQYPDRRVIVPDSTGSDGGIRVVGQGHSPIGRVSRRPTSEETEHYGDFKYVEFARVSVTFVVTPAAGVRELTGQQVCDIFLGRVTNWQDVGGNDLPIDVQARPEDGSNMRAIRKQLPCFGQSPVTGRAHFNLRNGDLVDSMRKYRGAIGFMPLSEALLHGYQVVTLDGLRPGTPEYKLGIGLGFVYQKPLPARIQAFIDYLRSERAVEVMRQTGHVPVTG